MGEVRIGVRELRVHLTRYLREASEGTRILVTSRDVVIAEIGAPRETRTTPREFGALRGKIWIADDFDTWPDDIVDSFET